MNEVFFKAFDFELKYHPGNVNKVTYVLSWEDIYKVDSIMLEYALLGKF
jgi:hypothetical protein